MAQYRNTHYAAQKSAVSCVFDGWRPPSVCFSARSVHVNHVIFIMMWRYFCIPLWLLLGLGCSGIQAPKERILRTSTSYEKDLTQLREYLGIMPVDVVVEGYRPASDDILSVEYSSDSVEATIKQVAIAHLTPEYTELRSWTSAEGTSIRIPTKNVTRIHAQGERPYMPSKWPYGSIALSTLLVILGIVFVGLEGKAFDKNSGCGGGCLFLGVMLGAAALLILGIPFLSGNEPTMTFEQISKIFIIQ